MISLSHIKEPAKDDGLPKSQKKIMAWSGGKISSNKEVATLKFVRKKLERGESLSEEQSAIVAKFSLADAAVGSEDILKSLEASVASKRLNSDDDEDGKKKAKVLPKSGRFAVTASGGFVTKRGGKQTTQGGVFSKAGGGKGINRKGKGGVKGGGKGKSTAWSGGKASRSGGSSKKSTKPAASAVSMLDGGLSTSR